MGIGRLIALVSLSLLAALVLWATVSYTPPIFKSNSIATLTAVEINGDRQFLLIRGHDRNNPVLLFLHGGPGMPSMFLAHEFQRELEEHFVVVHWDQRASGKSFRGGIDPQSLSISQLLHDTEAVAQRLTAEFGQEKIWLAGHSHGSYLGVLFARQNPELIHAFISIGQTTNSERAFALQKEFLKSQLPVLGLPANTEITSANKEDLLFKTHSELYGADSFMPLIFSGLMAPEYSFFDVMNVAKGSSFSSTHMKYDVIGGDVTKSEFDFGVPVIMMMGEHDMTTPTSQAKEYFDQINAPFKKWILFENSAHFPFYEEPARFTQELVALQHELAAATE